MRRVVRRLSVLLTAALASIAAGCAPVPTQIVVRIRTDIPADLLERVRVLTSYRTDEEPRLHDFYPGRGDAPLPAHVAINPREGTTDGRIHVVVAPFVFGEDGSAFLYEADVEFTPHAITVLDVFLADRCRNPVNASMCNAATETCGAGAEPCPPRARGMLPVANDL